MLARLKPSSLAIIKTKQVAIKMAILGVGSLLFLLPLAYLAIFNPSAVEANPGTLSFTGFDASPKTAGVPFMVTIKASDPAFVGNVSLSDTTGTISPTQTGNFVAGVWTGNIVITKATPSTYITAMFDVAHQITSPVGVQVSANQASAQLSIVSGNGQAGIVTTQLNDNFVVRTVDPFGNVLSGVNVAFSIQSYPAGASGTQLTATAANTPPSGQAVTKLRLGTKAGSYAVQASVNNGASAVTFFANATPAALHTMKMVPSASVMVQRSIQQFSLTAADAHGNPINLSAVSWRVTNGGGTIDSNGLFTSGNQLGSFPSTVEATVGSVTATATVTVMSSSNQNLNNQNSTGNPESDQNVGLLSHVVITPDTVAVPTNAQQLFTAQAYDVFNNALATISYTWEATGDIGNISTGIGPTTLLQSAAAPSSGSLSVTAIQGEKRVTAQATVSVEAGKGGNIVFGQIESPQKTGTPFTISITVKDAANNTIDGTPTPIVLSDSTGTISPRVITDLSAGVWTGEVTIHNGDDKVVILATSSGFAGSSNVFKVEGEDSYVGSARGTSQVLSFVDNNKLAFAVVAGLGILGSAMALGILGSKGLQAVGRNPLAKKQIFLNLYLNAGIAILVGFISVALALMLKNL